MEVSISGGTPKSSIYKWIFHQTPSILGYPNFWKPRYHEAKIEENLETETGYTIIDSCLSPEWLNWGNMTYKVLPHS